MNGDVWEKSRAAFLEAAEMFANLVASLQVDTEALEKQGLGEWTVRDLIGHTARALSTVETYLKDESSESNDLNGAVDYYLFVGRHTNHADVAERGRQAGKALGERPAENVRATLGRVEQALSAAHADTLAETPAGRMRIAADYLPTRTCELVVHSLDLIRATSAPAQVPADALRQTADLLYGLSRALGHDEAVVAFLGGREAPRLALFGE